MTAARVSAGLLVACLAATSGIEARQAPRVPGVQRFDQPAPGARSPRNANYQIRVRLDHETRSLRGEQTVRWRNISANATGELRVHLYWNAWRNQDSSWLRERRLAGMAVNARPDAAGRLDVTRVRLRDRDGHLRDLSAQQRFIAPDDSNADDRTLMALGLPRLVAPGESIELEIEWTARVPRPFARTGYIDDYYFIAHWYPKVGVLEDRGWAARQFHAPTEFYADYGVYDVSLTVPAGWLVGASGLEQSRAPTPDGMTTHRYRGEDIHDFAWTTSPRFIESYRTFTHPTLPAVEMRLLLQPEHAAQRERHFNATAAALKYYGEWFGPYPYGYLTIVDAAFQSVSQAMEYPTLFTLATRWLAPETVRQPQFDALTIHEAGHQFWYGIVASNEVDHAWMDEGLAVYATARVLEQEYEPNHLALRFFGGFVPWVVKDIRYRRATDGNRLPGYRVSAGSDVPATPTWRYWPATANVISYNKTSLWLHTLERYLGWATLQRALSTYFDRWKFRHPTPEALFATISEASGRDLDWFFDQVHRGSATFDYAIQALRIEPVPGGYRTTVVAQRVGDATFPVEVETTFEDGESAREQWEGTSTRVVYQYVRRSRGLSAQVDPDGVLLLDVNRTNNSRTTAPRANEASLKWSLKWMTWLQELMLTYAFLV